MCQKHTFVCARSRQGGVAKSVVGVTVVFNEPGSAGEVRHPYTPWRRQPPPVSGKARHRFLSHTWSSGRLMPTLRFRPHIALPVIYEAVGYFAQYGGAPASAAEKYSHIIHLYWGMWVEYKRPSHRETATGTVAEY